MYQDGSTDRSHGMTLLPRARLVRTGPLDHADWNYRGLLGAIQRRRFRLVLELMGSERYRDLLELGFGSGVFAPELSRRCERYCGIDLHASCGEVSSQLRAVGVDARLARGSLVALPFADASFDCIVAISVLEFVDAIDAVCREIARTLRPGGRLFVVTPGSGALLDLGLGLLTGESARRDFGDRRRRVIPALRAQFEPCVIRSFPSLTPPGLCLYRAFALTTLRCARAAEVLPTVQPERTP